MVSIVTGNNRENDGTDVRNSFIFCVLPPTSYACTQEGQSVKGKECPRKRRTRGLAEIRMELEDRKNGRNLSSQENERQVDVRENVPSSN